MVLGEVGEVLGIEGGQGEPLGEAAGGDPGVVDRVGASPPLSVRRQVTPQAGDIAARFEEDALGQPGVQGSLVTRAPTSQSGPLGHLTHGDKAQAPQFRSDDGHGGCGQPTPKAQRGDVGVEYYVIHWPLRQIRLALGVIPREEGVELLVGLEHVIARDVV
jgi:hypothetical protein